MKAILECKGLSKAFGRKRVLRNIDLELERGKIIGLLGPNASGKTTFLKLANDLLTPSAGKIYIDGFTPGLESKKIISYLPEKTYLNEWMRIEQLVQFFADFYEDFSVEKAYDMLKRLQVNPRDRLKTLSKGTKEKVQLCLVMARQAKLYLLDEPIGGVDPAARDFILETIINNYQEDATIVISTHLIADIEKVLDYVIFLKEGEIALTSSVDEIRTQHGKSVDSLFREVFKC
ncbi:MAG: ABC transporter ATP-binding protein [Firmicutes bacterium]|nr:ABC transporter ATP-binding protein [Bacillota bacterium]